LAEGAGALCDSFGFSACGGSFLTGEPPLFASDTKLGSNFRSSSAWETLATHLIGHKREPVFNFDRH
jgi:hypothetical protein